MHPKVPKQQQAVLDRKMFLLFCMNGIPFNVADSPYFLDFVLSLNMSFKPVGGFCHKALEFCHQHWTSGSCHVSATSAPLATLATFCQDNRPKSSTQHHSPSISRKRECRCTLFSLHRVSPRSPLHHCQPLSTSIATATFWIPTAGDCRDDFAVNDRYLLYLCSDLQ